MNVERNAATESIDYVIFYIQAMLQWVKVSFATLLSIFYCYIASDIRKCINYCLHCRKLKCIHFYTFNFRKITFDHKSDSMSKTIPVYCQCGYKCWYTPLPYSLIANTATQFLGGNLLGNLLGIVKACDSVCVLSNILKKDLNLVYMYIFWLENKSIT